MDAATLPTHDELLTYRAEFLILERKTYLNSCSLGALSRRSMDGLAEYQDLWNTYGAAAWYSHWIPMLADLRAAYGRVIGAGEGEVALSPNVSTALTMAASCIDHSRRPKVVVADVDFPTIAHQWLAKRSLGVEVVVVPSDGGLAPTLDRWESAIDERTALVATSQVCYTSGRIQDVAAIAALARAKGALCLVDGYQAAGQMPVDVHSLGVDFYVGGSLKWLLGGQGMAYLWVRPELIRSLHPTVTGWFAVDSQFNFDGSDLRLRPDAVRFEYGTPSVPSMYTALGGLSIVNEIGVVCIRERTDYLTRDLVTKLRAREYSILAPDRPEEHASITMVETPDAAATVATLARLGVIADHRFGLLRLSSYFYNTTKDHDRMLDALDEATAGQSPASDSTSSATIG
ncbi:MAG: aminotransferase class V-fold PLP-dependent enzyme [Chloroflexia bacterium]